MPHRLMTTDVGDLNSGFLPNDTGAQAGGGGQTTPVKVSGNLGAPVAPTGGLAPAGTGADYVVGVLTVPAGAFDQAGRQLDIFANGSFAANGDTKTVKLIANPTAAVVGSAVSGGTTFATTGAVTTNGAGWSLSGSIVKTGANGSNTQNGIHAAAQCGAAVQSLAEPQALTMNEAAAITIAVTINCATAASDAALWLAQPQWFN